MSLDRIDSIILCGGLGTRLRSFSGKKPKVMMLVGGRPFLDILLVFLKQSGIRHVILALGYKAEMIEQYYHKKDIGLDLSFSREQQPLGTGGGLKLAEPCVRSDDVFVFNGDSFCRVDLENFYAFHQTKKSLVSVVVAEMQDEKDFGGVVLGKNQEILQFNEKNQGNTPRKNVWMNAGIYCFKREALTHMPKSAAFSLEYDFFPQWIKKRFYGFCIEEKCFDIGTPQRYQETIRVFKKGYFK